MLTPGTDVQLPIASDASVVSEEPESWTISHGHQIGYGRLGVAFKATLHRTIDQPAIPVIAKVVPVASYGSHIPADVNHYLYDTGLGAKIAAQREALVYAALSSKQGGLLPYYYGLFTSGPTNDVVVALLSDAGQSIKSAASVDSSVR